MAKLIVAKSGSSVYDLEKNLSFTSDRNCLIELVSGTQYVSTTGYYQHGLGYSPAYSVFLEIISPEMAGVPRSWSPCIGYLGNVLDGGLCTIDNDKLYFETYTVYNTATGTYDYVPTNFYYDILSNQMNDATVSGKTNVSGKMRIARTGLSVPDISDARQFQFFVGNIFKRDTILSGVTNISVIDYGFSFVEITHNLGYVPVVYCFETDNGSRVPYSLPGGFIITYYITSTKLYIVAGDLQNPGGYSVPVSYTILRDKIA